MFDTVPPTTSYSTWKFSTVIVSAAAVGITTANNDNVRRIIAKDFLEFNLIL